MVLEAVRSNNHPSAREIFEDVATQEGKSAISFGTVYRNLQVLEEEGDIARLDLDPQVVRYDCRMEPHYHLRCRSCGELFDFPVICSLVFDREAQENSGFVVESETVLFQGLCPNCAAGKS